jgi:hypothetical protein
MKNRNTIKFSRKYYSLSSIEKTVKEFSSLGEFVIGKERNNFIVKMIGKEDILKDEFSNYVLGEIFKEL